MENRPEKIKNTLFTIIRRLCADPESAARHPEKDFTRRRKLWPERLVKLLLAMGGGTLNSELLEHFNCSADTPRLRLHPTAGQAAAGAFGTAVSGVPFQAGEALPRL